MTRILATSAGSVNGGGCGAGSRLRLEGRPDGPFSSDARIVEPRGLSLDPSGALIYLNSGDDRVLALDHVGEVVRDSGRIPGMDRTAVRSGPEGRYYVALRRRQTILVMPSSLDEDREALFPDGIVPPARVRFCP